MNVRKGILEELKTAVKYKMKYTFLHITLSCDEIKKMLVKIYEHYFLYDLECSTSHAAIFKTLYLLNTEESYAQIAERFFLDYTTLKRYIKKYNDFTVKYILNYRLIGALNLYA